MPLGTSESSAVNVCDTSSCLLRPMATKPSDGYINQFEQFSPLALARLAYSLVVFNHILWLSVKFSSTLPSSFPCYKASIVTPLVNEETEIS